MAGALTQLRSYGSAVFGDTADAIQVSMEGRWLHIDVEQGFPRRSCDSLGILRGVVLTFPQGVAPTPSQRRYVGLIRWRQA